jgi:putative Holliday junction resolvase
MSKGRLAAIDYGTVRIGISLTDLSGIIAQPFKTIAAKKSQEGTAKELLAALQTHAPIALVIGLPLMMNGKDSPMSLQVRAFAEILKTLCSIPIILWDERLTSKQVERLLIDADVKRKKRGELVDALAATCLLQNYLEAQCQSVPQVP